MKWIKPIMLFCFFSFVQTGFAQDISEFKKIEGLNSNVVYCVMQDSKGYIWVGTEAGAARYDGYKFTFYTMEDGLTDNDVFQIHEDHKGRLWLLTNNGKPCLYENGKILNVNNTKWLQFIQPKKLAKSFLLDKDKSIWFCTLDTIYHFVNDKVVERISPPKFNFAENNNQGLFNYNDTNYVLLNHYVYNLSSKVVHLIDPKFAIINNYTQASQIGDEIYYFSGDNFFVFSLKQKSPKLILKFAKTDKGIGFLKSNNTNTLWVSTRLFLYEMGTKIPRFTKLPFTINLITQKLIDREGNQWLSSLSDGLFLRKKHEISATKLIITNGIFKKGESNSIDKIDGKTFIGYNDGNYIMLKDSIITYEILSTKNVFGRMRQINNTANGTWFSIGSALIHKFNKREYVFPLTGKYIMKEGEFLYISSSLGVLKILENKYLKETENIRQFDFTSIQSISKTRTNVLYSLNKDSLFAGGLYGLEFFVKDKKNEFSPWKTELTKNPISKIIKTKDGQIAISSSNAGVGILYKDTVFTFNKEIGLKSNICNSIYSPDFGVLWVATSLGINKINYKILSNKRLEYSIEDYTSHIKNKPFYCSDIAQYGDSLIVATEDGTYIHEFSKFVLNKSFPNISIESLLVNGKVLPAKPDYYLKPSDNNIKFRFVGLSFQSKDPIQYRYKLMPIDTAWHYTENTNIDYPYLLHGKYTFLVTASLSNGIWNPQPERIVFEIKTPFYLTGWFIGTAFLLFFIFGYAIFIFRLNMQSEKNKVINKAISLEKENAVLESEKLISLNKLIELEQKSLSLQMNPHFIFNVISAIKGLYANSEIIVANNYVDTFAVLMRTILDTNLKPLITLKEEISILESYLTLAILRYDKKFTYSIVIDTNINQLYIPPMLLQPFLENAIIHGIAPLNSPGHVNLHFFILNKCMICELSDNGVGRKKSEEINNYRLHESKGIYITQQRLLAISPNSKLEITDILNEQGFVIGTKVYIEIPFN